MNNWNGQMDDDELIAAVYDIGYEKPSFRSNFNKIMEYKDKLPIKKVIIEMKGIIPDLTENKIKKIWSGILVSR